MINWDIIFYETSKIAGEYQSPTIFLLKKIQASFLISGDEIHIIQCDRLIFVLYLCAYRKNLLIYYIEK